MQAEARHRRGGAAFILRAAAAGARRGRVAWLASGLFAAILFCACAGSVAAQGPVAPSEQAPPRVLGLLSYDPLFPSSISVLEAWRDALLGRAALRTEFLDLRDHPGDAYRDAVARRLAARIAATGPPDVVLVSDDEALSFAIERRAALFPDAAIVFSGVSDPSVVAAARAAPNVYGLVDAVDLSGAVALASALHPRPLRRIVAVHDGSLVGVALEAELSALVARRGSLGYVSIDLRHATLAEAAARLRRLDDGSTAALVLTATSDRDGRRYGARDVGETLTGGSAPLGPPVYRLWRVAIRSGVVGGVTISNAEHAAGAAEIALAAAAGAPPRPTIAPGPVSVVIDAAAALARGLDLAAAPAGALILNPRPRAGSDLYAISMTVLSGLLVLLSGALLISRLRANAIHKREMARRLAQQALEIDAGRRLIQGVFDTAPVALEAVDCDRQVIARNAVAEALRLDDDVASGEGPIAQALSGARVVGAMTTSSSADDAPRRLRVNAAPLRDPDGALIGAVAAAMDVTREIDALEAAHGARELLDRALSTTRSGLFALDGEERVVIANPAAAALLGIAADGACDAQAIAERRPRFDASVFRNAETLERLVAVETAQALFETIGDGGLAAVGHETGPRFVRLSARRVDGPAPLRVVVGIEDVTDEAQARRALERANEDLKQYAYVASHDLQEPFRKIMMHADLASKTEDADRRAAALAVVRAAAARGRSLVSRLLEYARLGAAPLERSRHALADVVADARADVAEALAEADGSVAVEGLEGVSIFANGVMLRQILDNFFANSIKYRSKERALTIAVRGGRDDDGFTLIFEDNGIGFDMAYADGIFEPFSRLHGRAIADGSGVGLAIVAKAVERHGWSVAAEGAPDQGARFILKLSDEDVEVAEKAANTDQAPSTSEPAAQEA